MAHKIRHKPHSHGRFIGSPALATVLEVDLPGLPPGVYLAPDEQVNGATTAYASHTGVRLVHDAA
ncbi:hypothetical protein P6B95_00690 [Streptomyces atratus]|uniref:hypothetical protein n=1 Tax=Streptomyces atratus TaxID=1893 RepID=UPI002AC348AA|nr:hypothetical protein [Streptomyces atratus]WPW26135.1 hypothetical protein P6B95_00690 [Streptomyces atratus]